MEHINQAGYCRQYANFGNIVAIPTHALPNVSQDEYAFPVDTTLFVEMDPSVQDELLVSQSPPKRRSPIRSLVRHPIAAAYAAGVSAGISSEMLYGSVSLDLAAAVGGVIGGIVVTVAADVTMETFDESREKVYQANKAQILESYLHTSVPVPNSAISGLFDTESLLYSTSGMDDPDAPPRPKTGEILDWLETKSGDKNLYTFNADGTVQAHNPADIVVNTNTSLFELYKRSRQGFTAKSNVNSRERELQLAKDFKLNAHDYANVFGLSLKKSSIQPTLTTGADNGTNPLLRLIYKTEDKVEDIMLHMQDAKCTAIAIGPTYLVKTVLQDDHEPGELWSEIITDLEALHEQQQRSLLIDSRSQQLKKLDTLTGTQSKSHKAESEALNQERVELTTDSLDSVFSISGKAMVRQRKKFINDTIESLFEGINDSNSSADQRATIALYGSAITALAASPVADSSKLLDDGRKLRDYLSSAAQLADGSDETMRRLYDGMRNAVPNIGLPPQMN